MIFGSNCRRRIKLIKIKKMENSKMIRRKKWTYKPVKTRKVMKKTMSFLNCPGIFLKNHSPALRATSRESRISRSGQELLVGISLLFRGNSWRWKIAMKMLWGLTLNRVTANRKVRITPTRARTKCSARKMTQMKLILPEPKSCTIHRFDWKLACFSQARNTIIIHST